MSPASREITGYPENWSEPPEKSAFEQVRNGAVELTQCPFLQHFVGWAAG
jgi:hypothetical protein